MKCLRPEELALLSYIDADGPCGDCDPTDHISFEQDLLAERLIARGLLRPYKCHGLGGEHVALTDAGRLALRIALAVGAMGGVGGAA